MKKYVFLLPILLVTAPLSPMKTQSPMEEKLNPKTIPTLVQGWQNFIPQALIPMLEGEDANHVLAGALRLPPSKRLIDWVLENRRSEIKYLTPALIVAVEVDSLLGFDYILKTFQEQPDLIQDALSQDLLEKIINLDRAIFLSYIYNHEPKAPSHYFGSMFQDAALADCFDIMRYLSIKQPNLATDGYLVLNAPELKFPTFQWIVRLLKNHPPQETSEACLYEAFIKAIEKNETERLTELLDNLSQHACPRLAYSCMTMAEGRPSFASVLQNLGGQLEGKEVRNYVSRAIFSPLDLDDSFPLIIETLQDRISDPETHANTLIMNKQSITNIDLILNTFEDQIDSINEILIEAAQWDRDREANDQVAPHLVANFKHKITNSGTFIQELKAYGVPCYDSLAALIKREFRN